METDDKNLISSLQSMRDRLMAVLGPRYGEAFDGDMDTLLDAINALKRHNAATRNNRERVTDTLGYTITLRNIVSDGQPLTEARVLELPDAAEYADNPQDAYLLACDLIEMTAEAFAGYGRAMPTPAADEWQMVPKVPTMGMRPYIAAETHDRVNVSYTAMLAAAPRYGQPPKVMTAAMDDPCTPE